MGKPKGVKKKLGLAQVTSAYVGKPFEEGGWGDSYDCGSFLVSIAEKLKLHTLDEDCIFSKKRHAELVELWRTDQSQVIRLAMDYLHANCDLIDPMRMRPGDVVAFNFKERDEIIFGLCGGNGHILGSFINKGVTLVKVELLDIKQVFRLQFK